jgi:hypothetical protein
LQSNQNFNTPYKIYSAGDYAFLYNALFTYDWSALYNETPVDAAVDRLNTAGTQAIDSAVPSGRVTRHVYTLFGSLAGLELMLRRTIFIDVTISRRLTFL